MKSCECISPIDDFLQNFFTQLTSRTEGSIFHAGCPQLGHRLRIDPYRLLISPSNGRNGGSDR